MDEVNTINQFGGHLEAAIGIPEEQLREASKSAVCKINISWRLRSSSVSEARS